MNDFSNKIIVGSEEWCSLPMMGVPIIKARIDSGAKTSALHAFNINRFTREGVAWVSYELHPVQNNRRVVVRCESEVVDRRLVKSSSGVSEKRYVVKTLMQLAGQAWEIEITLTNRDSMGYRMLMGRGTMQDRILVDPSSKLLCGDFSRDAVLQQYGQVLTPVRGLKIGLLASNPDLYSNKRIIEAAEERGHEIKFYDIKQCYMKLDADEPEVHYRGGKTLILDAVIPRIKPSITFYGCALVRQFESIGVYSLNSSQAITSARDKLFSLQVMLQNGLDIPTSGFANSINDTNDLIEMVNGAPLIVKLLEGSQGRGVVMAETTQAAESVVNAFKSLRANLLVQEFIKEADGKDLRLFVLGGKVVAAMQRQAADGEFRANVHRGGRVSVVKVTQAERQMAVKATKVLGLEVAGVDIIRSSKGPLLLEVNSSPGLEGIETATGTDLARKMISAIEKKLKWERVDS